MWQVCVALALFFWVTPLHSEDFLQKKPQIVIGHVVTASNVPVCDTLQKLTDVLTTGVKDGHLASLAKLRQTPGCGILTTPTYLLPLQKHLSIKGVPSGDGPKTMTIVLFQVSGPVFKAVYGATFLDVVYDGWFI